MKVLHLITARAGSKGLPGKNIKTLGGKPLFMYSVDFAKKNMKKEDVLCISTNDDELLEMAKQNGVDIPFKRPESLASDTASSQDVINHAIQFYTKQGMSFDAVLLLQPTSPFRADEDYKEFMSSYSSDVDMVVSVKQSKENPYFTLFEEDEQGLLLKSKKGNFVRRQDCPDVYAYNGSMYLINIKSVENVSIGEFKRIKKVLMPDSRSVDIDTMADWVLAEYYLGNKMN